MTTTYAILSSLVGKESQHFRRRTWPTFAARHRCEPQWFQELAALEILRDEAQWLDRTPTLTAFPGTHPLARSEARRRYLSGESLYLVGLDRVDERLRTLCDGLAKDLALAPSCVSIEAWAAGSATRVRWHYDLDFNFNIQILGDKTWHTSSYLTEENPIRSFHTQAPGPHGADVETNDPEPPDAVLQAASAWAVQPGDVVYLPRGVWHATEASAATLAMAFVIKPPTWAEHVTHILLERMHLETRWRERVLGAQNLREQPALRNTAGEALAASQRLLAEVGAAEMMYRSFWSGAPKTVRVSEQAKDVTIEAIDAKTFVTWRDETRRHELEVPIWAKNAIVHLISDRGPHSVAALHERVAALDVPFLNTFLTRLAEAGFLRFVSR